MQTHSLVAHIQGLEYAKGSYASKRQLHQMIVSVHVIRLSSRYLVRLHTLCTVTSHVYTEIC
jgi:hypothetical protein